MGDVGAIGVQFPISDDSLAVKFYRIVSLFRNPSRSARLISCHFQISSQDDRLHSIAVAVHEDGEEAAQPRAAAGQGEGENLGEK